MSWSQRLSFLLLQPYYPSVAVSWILSVLLTSAYMISRVSLHLPIDRWALLWGASIGSNFLTSIWLRRFNLTHHERKEWGFVGLMLQLMAAPVFVAAAASKLTGRKLAYAVTAKGDLASPDNIRTFVPHLLWLAWGSALLALSLAGVGSSWPGLRFWATVTSAPAYPAGGGPDPDRVHLGLRAGIRGRARLRPRLRGGVLGHHQPAGLAGVRVRAAGPVLAARGAGPAVR
jgi:cellulose synthase (UDP-forming)